MSETSRRVLATEAIWRKLLDRATMDTPRDEFDALIRAANLCAARIRQLRGVGP